ncbi:MAG: DUF6152 family protein [Acidimicrobiia bacterium]
MIFAAVLAAASSAAAHHSLAIFSTDTVVVVKGTVSRVDWRSPHTTIFIESKEPGGQTVEWRIETTPTSWLTSEGWTRDSLKPGDQVTAETNPYMDRSVKFGWLLRVTKADGTILLTRFSNRLKDPKAPPTTGTAQP